MKGLIRNLFVAKLCRIFLGSVFVLSGFVKAIDPIGFAYKINEYFHSFNLDVINSFSKIFSILICGMEIFIGLSFLCGIRQKTISTLTIWIMGVFSVITLYLLNTPNGLINDCGCFGDAIHLTNQQTFTKNIILLIISVYYFLFNRYYYISNQCQFKKTPLITIFLAIISFMVPMYSVINLPPFDFMPFNIGENILKNRDSEKNFSEEDIALFYKNKQTNIIKIFSINETEWHDDNIWTFIKTETISRTKSQKELLKNFSVHDIYNEDITELVFSTNDSYVFAVVARNLESLNERDFTHLNSLFCLHNNNSIKLYIFTSSSLDKVSDYKKTNPSNEIPVVNLDDTVLKSMIRADKGVIVLNKGQIIGKFKIGAKLNKITASNLDAIKIKSLIKSYLYFVFIGIIILILRAIIVINN